MEHSELMADLREMNDKVVEGYKRAGGSLHMKILCKCFVLASGMMVTSRLER